MAGRLCPRSTVSIRVRLDTIELELLTSHMCSACVAFTVPYPFLFLLSGEIKTTRRRIDRESLDRHTLEVGVMISVYDVLTRSIRYLSYYKVIVKESGFWYHSRVLSII